MRNFTDETSQQDSLKNLLAFARTFGDVALVPARDGFANAVYIGNSYVYKVHPRGSARDPTAKERKEARVLELLTGSLDISSQSVVPKRIAESVVPKVGYVLVQERLIGNSPVTFGPGLGDQLGTFLRALHEIRGGSLIDEYDDEKPVSFKDYVLTKPRLFAEALFGRVKPEDRTLIQRALDLVGSIGRDLPAFVPLVLVHKDLAQGNVLVENDRLTGVIDWEAAQTAPREWEFAILRQRAPSWWERIHRSYGHSLDQRLLDCCAVVQSLRFWKSYPEHPDFALQQRNSIRDIIGNAV